MPELIYDDFFSKEAVYNKRKYSKLHFHNTIELYYLTEGRVKYFIDNNSYQLNKGDLIIVPQKKLHSNDSENCLYNERLLLNFYQQDVSPKVSKYLQALSEDFLIVIPEDKQPIIEDMFLKIADEFSKKTEDGAVLSKLYLNELLVYLYRYRKKDTDANHHTDSLIDSISDYIFLNYNHDITLSELSKKFSLSESYISRRFKSVMGTSTNEYINFVKISKAVELIKTKKIPITEIATSCGFNDSNYFSTVFKKFKGVSPYKFMKDMHKQ